jgi:L-threonylcarbamoyladenylate synthase
METMRDVAKAADLLRRGGLLAYPTETFYGLGALASCRPALARLSAAKLRPAGKPLPVIVGRREDLTGLVALVEPVAERLAERFWPGPLTLVLPAVSGLPGEITEAGTVAVRVPGSPLARALAGLSGGPVISTSANPSGATPPVRADDLDPALVRHLDAVLDAGPVPGGLPSTIVAIEAGRLRLVRAGAVSWHAVLAAAS